MASKARFTHRPRPRSLTTTPYETTRARGVRVNGIPRVWTRVADNVVSGNIVGCSEGVLTGFQFWTEVSRYLRTEAIQG